MLRQDCPFPQSPRSNLCKSVHGLLATSSPLQSEAVWKLLLPPGSNSASAMKCSFAHYCPELQKGKMTRLQKLALLTASITNEIVEQSPRGFQPLLMCLALTHLTVNFEPLQSKHYPTRNVKARAE